MLSMCRSVLFFLVVVAFLQTGVYSTGCPAGSYCPVNATNIANCNAAIAANKFWCWKDGTSRSSSQAGIDASACNAKNATGTDAERKASDKNYIRNAVWPNSQQWPVTSGWHACISCTNKRCQARTCPIGSYCPAGSTSATPCPAGSYCSNITTKIQCPAGSYCPGTPTMRTQCKAAISGGKLWCWKSRTSGPASDSGLHATGCNWGTYNYIKYAVWPNSQQWPTEAKYGACTSCDDPKCQEPFTCPIGSRCPANSTSPTKCAKGYYCSSVGLSEPSRCNGGQYCPDGIQVLACGPGTYCPEWYMSAPLPCPAGKYCPSANNNNPPSCPAGSYCPANSTNPTACLNSRYCPVGGMQEWITCPEKFYCVNGTTKLECPAGKFCVAGTHEPTPCNVVGAYCPKGSATITACPAGYYCTSATIKETCPRGTYCPNMTQNWGHCPAGYYCHTTTYKTPCPPGYACVLGSHAPVPCNIRGSYCPLKSTHVAACPAGFFCPNSTTNIQCPAGSYCLIGSELPRTCKVHNSYCPVGSTTYTICPSGFVCPTPGEKIPKSTVSSSMAAATYQISLHSLVLFIGVYTLAIATLYN